MATLRELVTDIIDEGAFGRISGGIINNDNELARRALAISNRVIKEMAEAYPWRELWKTAEITLADGVSEYALPSDFNYYIMDTWWNQGEAWTLYGAITPNELAFINGYNIQTLPTDQYYIRGLKDKRINITPAPDSEDVGKVIAFEYQCRRPIRPKKWESGDSVNNGDYRFYDGNYYTADGAGTLGATPPTHTNGTASDGSVSWVYFDGEYDRFKSDTDEINLNERIFSQGVLERLSITTGQQVVARFDAELQAEWSRQAPAQTIDASGNTTAFTYARSGKAVFGTGI